jgi:hypothetical protein
VSWTGLPNTPIGSKSISSRARKSKNRKSEIQSPKNLSSFNFGSRAEQKRKIGTENTKLKFSRENSSMNTYR